jgi:hypothetical protein
VSARISVTAHASRPGTAERRARAETGALTDNGIAISMDGKKLDDFLIAGASKASGAKQPKRARKVRKSK